MNDILDFLQLGCAVKLDKFQAVRLGSYIKKLQSENEALTKLVSEKAMIHVSMNVADVKAEAVEGFAKALSSTVQIPNGPITRVDYYKAAIRHSIQFANQYAAKVRGGAE